MTRPGIYAVLWGCLLGVSAAVLWGWSFGLPQRAGCPSATCVAVPALAPALLTAAATASILLGLALLLRRTDGIDRRRRPVVDQSLASALTAIGVGLVALGGAVGAALIWMGLVVTGLGLAGVVRESLALRRLRSGDGGK